MPVFLHVYIHTYIYKGTELCSQTNILITDVDDDGLGSVPYLSTSELCSQTHIPICL